MNKLKILVVDDTVTYRKILSKVIESFKDTELLGTAANGKIALAKIKLKPPDLVLLDFHMPELNGMETLQRIKQLCPHIDVIMISGTTQEQAHLTMRALEAGALEFIPKPVQDSITLSINELTQSLRRLIPIVQTRKYSRQIKAITSANRQKTLSLRRDKTVTPPKRPLKIRPFPLHTRSAKIDVIAIGVSTGGPNALQEIIPRLRPPPRVPILAVQHMPPLFTNSLAMRLNNEACLRVVEAQNNQAVEKGVMYIAPGGRHMVVKADKFKNIFINLLDSKPVNSCRPAVDVLFDSIAKLYRGNVLTVILTGMGSDGAKGVATIRNQGGYSIVQDEKTSVVWGMPGTVAENNQADEIIPLPKIADRIMKLIL